MAKKQNKAHPKPPKAADVPAKRPKLPELEDRLREAEETLEAIRTGQVDALVVQGASGDQVFTLRGADHRYRQLVETMNEGALMLAYDGTIVYSNARFARMVQRPLRETIGAPFHGFLHETWHGIWARY